MRTSPILCPKCGSIMNEAKVPYRLHGIFIGFFQGYRCPICEEVEYKRSEYKSMVEASRTALPFKNVEYVKVVQKWKIEFPVPFISDNSTKPSEVSSSSPSRQFIQPTDLS